MIVRLLPFDLGYWIASFFIDTFHKEKIATRRRDEYIGGLHFYFGEITVLGSIKSSDGPCGGAISRGEEFL